MLERNPKSEFTRVIPVEYDLKEVSGRDGFKLVGITPSGKKIAKSGEEYYYSSGSESCDDRSSWQSNKDPNKIVSNAVMIIGGDRGIQDITEIIPVEGGIEIWRKIKDPSFLSFDKTNTIAL